MRTLVSGISLVKIAAGYFTRLASNARLVQSFGCALTLALSALKPLTPAIRACRHGPQAFTNLVTALGDSQRLAQQFLFLRQAFADHQRRVAVMPKAASGQKQSFGESSSRAWRPCIVQCRHALAAGQLSSHDLSRFNYMATKQPSTTGATEAEAETKLREALDKMKAASDRHAAIVAVMSRPGGSPQERRLAQSESKKVDRELQNAERLLREAQAAARTTNVRSAR
jgi:hypothetical protein